MRTHVVILFVFSVAVRFLSVLLVIVAYFPPDFWACVTDCYDV